MNKKCIRPDRVFTASRASRLISRVTASWLVAGCALCSLTAMGATGTSPSVSSAASGTGSTVMVSISPTVTHVNVIDGTPVNFVIGNEAFAWKFEAPHNVFWLAVNRTSTPAPEHPPEIEVEVAPGILPVF